MRYWVVHHTEYRYAQPVALCHNETHLKPRTVAHQRCLSHAPLMIAAVTFLLSLPLYAGFDTGTHAMQFVERTSWIEAFDINYHLGIDGISMPLILLTTFTTVIVVLAGWEVIQTRIGQYMASFLILEGLMNGVFAALDAILFYVFWQAMLIPMFLIIGIWGGDRRAMPPSSFFFIPFLGSVLMLVALLYLYWKHVVWAEFTKPDRCAS